MRPNILTPSSSGSCIADEAENIKINTFGLNKLADEILGSICEGSLSIPDIGHRDIHPQKNDPKAVDWIFVLDALNFCFWTKDDATKWKVCGHTGYNAFAAAIKRAIIEKYDITNPKYYSKINVDDLKHILRSDDNVTELALIPERVQILHEVGEVLLEKFQGTFQKCIEMANNSAVELVKLVLNEFPSFRDEGVYHGKKVSFYKRAQILVADLWNTFDNKEWGFFHDIDELTMFADYRVPQVLVFFNVLEYSDRLMSLLKQEVILENGSAEEIEIRGCSIHAIEMLKSLLRAKIKERDNGLQVPNSILLDYYLWCYRRKYEKELEHIPFHRVISIYY